MTLLTSLQDPTTPPPIFPRQRMAEVPSPGPGLADPGVGASAGRVGGGPTDHDVVALDGCTVMVPVHTGGASESSFLDTASDETAAGHWSAARLAVRRDFRRAAWIDAALLRRTVGKARARDCTRCLVHVQAQNAPLFHRLAWTTLRKMDLHGRPHRPMVADLSAYPHRSRTDVAVFPVARCAA